MTGWQIGLALAVAWIVVGLVVFFYSILTAPLDTELWEDRRGRDGR